MKRLRLLISCLLVAVLFSAATFAAIPVVNTYATVPAYPTMSAPITIYVNVLSSAILQSTIDTSTMVTVYTGLLTTASNNITGDWKHVKNSGWGDVSLVMTRENDSIYSLTINDPATFYGVNPTTEGVFRIAFIARGTLAGAPHGQTNNLYLEVFTKNIGNVALESTPAVPQETQMAAVSFNINKECIDPSHTLNTWMAAHPTDSVFVYTAVNTNLGSWVHEVSPWASVGTNPNLKTIKVSDSIYRLYYMPNIKSFYNETNANEHISQLNFVVRNGSGSKQTDNQYVSLMPVVDFSQMVNGIICYPTYPTMADHIYIFVNGKAYVQPSTSNTLNPASTFSTWSGLVTSESPSINPNPWTHQVNSGWSDFGDSVLLTRLDDSIQYWDIPSLASIYHLNAAENVYRIYFIARDTLADAVNHQMDAVSFEVYGSIPTALVGTQPAKLKEDGQAVYTFNINKSTNTTLKDYIATSHNDSVGIYTAINPAWSHEVAPWASVPTTANLQTIAVNDSIFRFYIIGSNTLRDFYGVTDTCEHIYQTNLSLRSDANGDAKTQDIIVLTDTIATCGTIVVGLNTVSEIAGITVYPNPVQQYLNFSFEKPENGSIDIFNIEGQKLFSVNISDQQNVVSVNLGEISTNSSVLIYKVTTSNGTAFGKILVKK